MMINVQLRTRGDTLIDTSHPTGLTAAAEAALWSAVKDAGFFVVSVSQS